MAFRTPTGVTMFGTLIAISISELNYRNKVLIGYSLEQFWIHFCPYLEKNNQLQTIQT